MDELLERIERGRDRAEEKRRTRSRAAAGRRALTDLCEAAAGWGPDFVVEFGHRPAEDRDVVVQLAWAFKEVARCVVRHGLGGRLKALAAKGDLVKRYACGLVRLAGQPGAGDELEERVRQVWMRPAVWLDVKSWLRKMPDVLWPCKESVTGSRREVVAGSPPPPSGQQPVPDAADGVVEWLGPKEVARYLGCSYGEARQRMLQGRIEAVKDGRRCRTRREWVEAYLERTKVAAAQEVPEVKARPARRRREAAVPTGGVAEAFLRDRKG